MSHTLNKQVINANKGTADSKNYRKMKKTPNKREIIVTNTQTSLIQK